MIFRHSLGLSDIDLVGAPAKVSALARTKVRVLPLGILITHCAIKVPRAKTPTSIRASALTFAGAPTKLMSLSSKIAKRMPENHS